MDMEVVLTRNEIELMKLYETGLTYKEMAEVVCIGPKALQTRANGLFKKLSVKNKQKALLWWILNRHKYVVPFFGWETKIKKVSLE